MNGSHSTTTAPAQVRATQLPPIGTQARRLVENDLALRYHREPHAREDIMRQLLPLAHGLARRFFRNDEPLEDLQQVAAVGLLKALNGFDASRGASFVAYAVPTIQGELRRHYRDHGWSIHVPRPVQELALRVRAAEKAHAESGPLTAAGLARALDTSVEAVVEARLALRGMRHSSLDAPTTDGRSTVGETLGGGEDRAFADVEWQMTFEALATELDERDRLVLTMRYVDGMTQRQISHRIGVSQMQVSRVLRRVHDQLAPSAATAI